MKLRYVDEMGFPQVTEVKVKITKIPGSNRVQCAEWFDADELTAHQIPHCYSTTNPDGSGIFFVDLDRNERKQLKGTWDFSVYGMSYSGALAKIRRWLESE